VYLPGRACGCAAGEKCTVVDATTGGSGCRTAGSVPPFGPCSSETDCALGSWCNPSSQACEPFCKDDADCGAAQCVSVIVLETSSPVPGLTVCSIPCDPMAASPCAAGLNCSFPGAHMGFECVLSQSATEGNTCTATADCAAPLACAVSTASTTGLCSPWCLVDASAATTACDGMSECLAINPPATNANGDTYGNCVPYD
jgi:hypothetical protein